MAVLQGKKKQSIFPDYPRLGNIVNEDNELTTHWDLFFNSLAQALQVNFKNEGIMLPWMTEDELDAILDLYIPYIGQPLPQNQPGTAQGTVLPDFSGQTVFDTTNRVPRVFIITFNTNVPPEIVTVAWKTYQLI